MDREGLRYFRQENCFPWVEDIPRAQQLFQEQPAVNWTERLQPFAQRLNPLHEEIFGNYPTQYYWSAFQCEWATGILFRPGLSGQAHGNFTAELTTDFKSRASGDRVKYRINGNSLKGYGKASTPVGDVFRVETLTQHVEVFKSPGPSKAAPRATYGG